MEDERQSLEELLRRSIRNRIIRENRMSAPICYDAETMLDKCVDIEIENIKDAQRYRPSYRAWGDDE